MAVVTTGQMGAEVQAASPDGTEPFTWDYLQTLPGDSLRRELVDGQILVTPSPVGRHQAVVSSLDRLLGAACPDDLRVVVSPYDWKISATTVFVPDLMVIRQAELDLDGWFTGTPLLVIEIRSPSTAVADRTLKRQQYEQYGAAAYWLVDPGGLGGGSGRSGGGTRSGAGVGGAPVTADRVPGLTALRLVDGAYQEEATVEGDEPYTADFPFPVTVVPAGLVR